MRSTKGKTVVRRAWWRFWRMPFKGLNPFAWYLFSERDPYGECWIDGYEIPGDGGEVHVRWMSKRPVVNAQVRQSLAHLRQGRSRGPCRPGTR